MDDVLIMRPIMVVFVIGIHAFNPYVKDSIMWPSLYSLQIPFYAFLTSFFHVFLPLFVFIAGYVYSCQQELYDKIFLGDILRKKARRLLIPSLFFGLIYYFLVDSNSSNDLLTTGLCILSGYAHLWFLPMLFWCFVLIYFVSRINKVIVLAICVILFLSPFWGGGRSLGINEMIHYFIYFYLGYLFGSKRRNLLQRILKYKYLFFCLVLFLSMFLFYYYSNKNYLLIKSNLNVVLLKYLLSVIHHIIHLLACVLAIVTMLIFSNLVAPRIKLKYLSFSFLITIGNMSMGIYIFQQFVLQIMYYHTSFHQYVNPYLLPWIGLIAAFVISAIMTNLLNRTRWGAFLLGK